MLLLAALLAVADPPKPPAWTLDTDAMKFPDAPAAGTLLGQPFEVKSAKLFSTSQLTLSSGEGKGAGDSYLWIVLGGLKKKTLVGETVAFGPELPFGTAIHVVRAEGPGGQREVQFPKAVAVKLQFGQVKNGKLPGRVYLCGGDKRTVVAGTFEVDAKDVRGAVEEPPAAPRRENRLAVAPAGAAPEYLTDPAKMITPDTPVAGTLMGGAFKLTAAELRGGVLTVRQGEGWAAAALLFLHGGTESPAGKTFLAGGPPDPDAKTPHVHLKRTPAGEAGLSEAMAGGHALRLEFGPARNGKIPGKLYLCCPDKGHGPTILAGRFDIDWPAK